MQVTLYHNPRCGNSRGALALLRERGIEPDINDYLGHPLDVPALRALVARIGVPLRDLLRPKEAVYAELDLGNPGRTEGELYAAVAAHPILLNRPIVVTPKGALLCRPPERVLELL